MLTVLTPVSRDNAEYKPFLFRIVVRSPKGDPLPNASIDLWHANTDGVYSYNSYNLRGRCTTDENGVVEVLTIAPGDYGAKNAIRVGHFHVMLQDKEKKYERLTTQVYVCKGNNVDLMQVDLCVILPSSISIGCSQSFGSLNYVRKTRPQNMLQSWSLPENNSGEKFLDFPELLAEDVETKNAIEWWDAKLVTAAPDEGLKLVGGGSTDIKLNNKPRWFWF